MQKKRFWRISLPALLITSGCAALFQPKTLAEVPVETYGKVPQAQELVVLLPGIRDRVEDFTKQGFIKIAQPYLEAQAGTALLAVDAHWGYYRERTIDARLSADIVQRYADKRLTFVGISLGGFGALLMATQHPDRVERLVLLSPFLGEDDYAYLEQLQQRGPTDRSDDEDLTRTLNRSWRFLLDPERRIPVTIAYGEDDDFSPYYQHLAAQNPANLQFIRIRGDHDWDTWRTLWTALAPGLF